MIFIASLANWHKKGHNYKTKLMHVQFKDSLASMILLALRFIKHDQIAAPCRGNDCTTQQIIIKFTDRDTL